MGEKMKLDNIDMLEFLDWWEINHKKQYNTRWNEYLNHLKEEGYELIEG